jgi:hypothetical protein
MDEGRKRVLSIAASILVARKLLDESVNRHSPRSMCVINGVIWAKWILEEIDRLFPTRK